MAVWLPLASSAGWFEGETLLDDLALRLKALLLFERELIVEPGGFLFRITTSEVREQFFPMSAVPWPRTPSLLGVSGAPGNVELKMDWAPLFEAARIFDRRGVLVSEKRLSPQLKRSLRTHVDRLIENPAVIAALPEQRNVREVIVKHWVLDLATAAQENACVSAGVNAARFFLALTAAIDSGSQQKKTISVRIPDLRTWSFEKVLAVRESGPGEELHALVDKARLAEVSVEELQAALDRVAPRGHGAEVAVRWQPFALAPMLGFVAGPLAAGAWLIAAV